MIKTDGSLRLFIIHYSFFIIMNAPCAYCLPLLPMIIEHTERLVVRCLIKHFVKLINFTDLKNKRFWKMVLQFCISVFTAALTALGTTSCTGHGPFNFF